MVVGREKAKTEVKGSRNKIFTEFAPEFGEDWVDLMAQHRRH